MQIKPFDRNGKKHPREQLAKIAASIERFGFRQPVVVDADGTIVVGHGRYEAARKVLGWKKTENKAASPKGDKTIPYVLADDLTPDEIAAYRLADNKLNESEWDMELVGAEMEALPEDLKLLTGFSDILDSEPEEHGYDGELPAAPRTKPGDIYELGAILYEIITGHAPHVGNRVIACLVNAANNCIRPTAEKGELVDIALRAMATEPHARHASVRDFQQAIRDYQSHVQSIRLGERAAGEVANCDGCVRIDFA